MTMPLLSSSGQSKSVGFTSGYPPVWTDNTIGQISYGQSFSDSVSATGSAPISYSVTSGSFPSGISLNTETGSIAGTSTTIGAWSATVRARNSVGAVDVTFSQTLAEPAYPPTLVQHTYNFGYGSSVSFSGASGRQSGDVAMVLVTAHNPDMSNVNAEKADPSGWTVVSSSYYGASLYDSNTGTLKEHINGFGRVYARTLNNTSSDSITVSLPQSMTWEASMITVRPATGCTYTTGGYSATFSVPDSSVGNFYSKLNTSSFSGGPVTVMNQRYVRGWSVVSGPQAYLSSSTSNNIGSLSSPSQITRAVWSSSRLITYKYDADGSAPSVYDGQWYVSDYRWPIQANGLLKWYRP